MFKQPSLDVELWTQYEKPFCEASERYHFIKLSEFSGTVDDSSDEGFRKDVKAVRDLIKKAKDAVLVATENMEKSNY